MAYFRAAQPGQPVRAVPGAGLHVPIWILGSSTFGAQVAAALGLPFAFASHFAPAHDVEAIDIYRAVRALGTLARPYVMLGVNVVAAETDAEARFLASSGRQAFASLRQGQPIELPPPSKEWERDPRRQVRRSPRLRASRSSAPPTPSRQQMQAFIARTQADELIVVSHIYDHAARLRSYEIASEIAGQITRGTLEPRTLEP